MNFGSVYTLHDSDDEEEAVREDAPSSVHLSAMSPAIGSTLGTCATGGSVPRLSPPAPAQGNQPVIHRQAAHDVDSASDMPDDEGNKEDMNGSGLENDPFSAIRSAFSHVANVVTSAGKAHPLPPATPHGYPPPDKRSMPRRGLRQGEHLQSRQQQKQLTQQQQQKQKSRSTHSASGRYSEKGNSQAPSFPPETGRPSVAANPTVFRARLPQTLADLAPVQHGAFGNALVLQTEQASVPAFLAAKSLPPADLAIRQRVRAPKPSRTWTRKVCKLCIE